MNYDKRSFLSGIAVGRQLKGWATAYGGGDVGVVTFIGQDGNKYAVFVDPDTGKLTKKLCPSSIKITTPPTKINYTIGERIDYSGIVVSLYDGNGNLFTDDRYTNGTAPFRELVLPVKYAPKGDGGGTIPVYEKTYTGGGGLALSVENASPYLCALFYSYHERTTYWPNCLLYSTIKETVRFSATPSAETMSPIMLSHEYVNEKGATVYWNTIDYDGRANAPIYGPATDVGAQEMIAIYGSDVEPRVDGNADVPVKWRDPYSREILTDKFTINIRE